MNQTKIDVQRIARELAGLEPFLGGWVYQERRGDASESWATLERADGATIHVHGNGYNSKGRLSISGGWPRTAAGEECRPWRGEGCPSIMVGASRPVKRIAAEIARRLLPEYLPRYAENLKRTKETDAARATSAERCAVLAALVNGKVRGDADKSVSWSHDGGGGYGDAQSATGESWNIKLNGVGFEQAQAILKILGGTT